MKNLPTITKSQKLILLFLLKFRFTKINQLQKHFNHKDNKRIKEWLKDLRKKKYIYAVVDKKDITKPYIYCLASRAVYNLEDANISEEFRNRIYKEKSVSRLFKEHLLFIVDIYLFFLSQKDKNSKLAFLTPQDLGNYEYLPKDIDAYIAIETNGKTKRYFLQLFDAYNDKTGLIRFSVRKFIKYSENGDWQANTNNSPMPSILYVMIDERRKAFVGHYGQAKLKKTFEDLSLFVSTQDTIRFNTTGQNIWKQIKPAAY